MDLGELDVPEPPLFFQAEPEEIDHFIDSDLNAMSAEASPPFSLLGPWSGSYSGGNQSEGHISFSITRHNEDGILEGSGEGADQYWAYTIVGTLNGVKIDFTKFSAVGEPMSRYVGNLDAETGTVIGEWDPPETGEKDEDMDKRDKNMGE